MTPGSSGNPDELVIYPSRTKMLLVLLGSVAFVAAGVWIGTSNLWRGPAILEVFLASYVGVPFFATCGIYAAYRLVRHRPALVIDRMGIIETSSALGAGRLSWDEVDHILLYKISGQPMLAIIPRELEVFLSRQHPVRRWLTTLNLRLGYAPVNVSQVALRMKVAELADLLRTRYGVRVEGDV
jgi:hypothetical protein